MTTARCICNSLLLLVVALISPTSALSICSSESLINEQYYLRKSPSNCDCDGIRGPAELMRWMHVSRRCLCTCYPNPIWQHLSIR
ncbi:hypothetical protein BJ165DRAFT_1484804 [Panaeolus papilionaceus]|nr:hypothetical protein BJ165DRAFT_1484804 [Panaeolus papilionaceus]